MRVGIYHVGANVDYLRLGALATRVAQLHGYEVVHLTDMDTPAIDGVDTVIRRVMKVPMAVFRMQHHQMDGEWLFIDSDVLIHKPVHGLFDENWSIAFSQRKPDDGTTTETADPLFQEMPYNMGVVFSRDPEFWFSVEQDLLNYTPELQRWMGDQLAWCRLIATGQFQVKTLPSGYNYPPDRDGKLNGAYIGHYKGKRKPMMIAHAMKLLDGADC